MLVLKTYFIKNSVDTGVISCPPQVTVPWASVIICTLLYLLYLSHLCSYISTQFNCYLILEITHTHAVSAIHDTIAP